LGLDWKYYQVKFSNVGGLPMPIIVEFEYADGSKERHYIPAEIWKMDATQVTKVFYSKKEVKRIVLDPNLQTADIDRTNNYWPESLEQSRFELYKNRGRFGRGDELNPMQKAKQ
jgi:hypothetical protein